MKFNLKKLRRWSRVIHRDLSFLFAGMLLIYAISGIVMNHRDQINPHYSLQTHRYSLNQDIPNQDAVDKSYVLQLLAKHGEETNYTKHYFPEINQLKVFLKGGSNYNLNLSSGEVVYEEVKKRSIIGPMAKLHYNPGKWWTVFADVFGGALIVITITGLIIVRGKKGLWGRGGVEFLIGLAIPLVFLLFF